MVNNIFLQHCCLPVHYPVCPSKTGLDANNNQENMYFLPRSFHNESNNQLEIKVFSEKKFKTEAGENCFRIPLCWLAIILLCIASGLGRSTGDLHFTLRMVIGSPPLCQKCTFLIPSLFSIYRLCFPTYRELGPVSDNVCCNVDQEVPEDHFFSGFITGFSQQRICWHTLPSSPSEQFSRARWSPPHGHGHDLPSWQCQCCERWTPHCRLHPSPIHLHLVRRSNIRAAVNNEFLQGWQNGEYTKST